LISYTKKLIEGEEKEEPMLLKIHESDLIKIKKKKKSRAKQLKLE